MAHTALLCLTAFLSPAVAVQMCTTLDRFKGVNQGLMLPGSQITNLTTTGMATCSRFCLLRRICKSFNFNVETGECQLNSKTNGSVSTQLESHDEFVFSDISHWPERLAGVCANHTCPLNSYCDPGNGSNVNHVCRVAYCLDTPKSGHVSTKSEASPPGTRLPIICDLGNMSVSYVVCQDNGAWSSPVCANITSCRMVKRFQADREDGEYWLSLKNFDNYATRIYCHHMNTSSPQEFLTLPNINYGIYPRVMNRHCTGTSSLTRGCKNQGGQIWFSKIRINIRTMDVVVKDKTFATISHSEKYLYYGIAHDCYTEHRKNRFRCGTKGRFNIDLRGTGWRVSEDQKWETYGWKPFIESIDRQMNGTVINLRCGGFGGGCRPIGGLFLKPFHEGLSKQT